MLKRVVAVMLLVVITGCGGVSVSSSSGPTLDTSSEDALLLSVEAMEESLEGNEEKQERFFGSIAYLGETRDGALLEALKDLHGSTVDDIIATADEEVKKME